MTKSRAKLRQCKQKNFLHDYYEHAKTFNRLRLLVLQGQNRHDLNPARALLYWTAKPDFRIL
jgi:hypothetical protein